MTTIAQKPGGRNGSILLQSSYTVDEIVYNYLKTDCSKLKMYITNLKTTTKKGKEKELRSHLRK